MSEATVITHVGPTPPVAGGKAGNRVRLNPLRRLTRAHLAIASRPEAVAQLSDATARVTALVGGQLKSPLACRATLHPSTVHPFSHLAAQALFFTIELGGEALGLLEVDLLGTSALLACVAGNNEPIGIPGKLSHIEEAALAWVVLSTLSAMRGEKVFQRFDPRLVALTLDRGDVLRQVDARIRYVAIGLELEFAELRCSGRLLIPAMWLQSVFSEMPVEPGLDPLDEVARAAISAQCLIGTAQLPSQDVGALTCGDVVLFAGVAQHASGLVGPGRVITPTFELRGTFADAGFAITHTITRPAQEKPMSKTEQVSVEVEIELTRLRLPVHQLGTIRPGAVLPLHINAAQHVVLRIGDQSVAHAELVEIEGEIGARIVAML